MKKIIALSLMLLIMACKKKNTNNDPAPTTTTTGGTPTVAVAPYAAEFYVNSTDYNYGIATAKFFTEDNTSVTVDGVKVDGMTMGIYPGNEYRYALSIGTYTAPVKWEISSGISFVPDTTFYSPVIPAIGFQKNVNQIYTKNQSFTVTVDASNCDSLFCTLGTVIKKIPGKTGITGITYGPLDNVKYNVLDSTRVDINVQTLNYSNFTVRGRKWKNVSTAQTISYFKYQ